ncbi:dihydropteroate synthase [Natroniella sulfidigena]|uniref:dihydropteroate synthase n=1 Tax=Natroniella sulfidigena TaxID=723921 RepID=UPI00200A1D29|nr:dihydropteroate synthase [Natroniella sulfidigena]MCK8815811.1 dihydropteroate synthase [Natroniella sulfidigena]
MFDFGSKTYIMGILNLTPDSFSDGGEYFQKDEAVKRAKKMVAQGADIIDVGAESTRPGSEKVSAEEELRRLTPVLNKLVAEIDVPISVDTYKAEVAKEVLELGVDIINDVRGLQWDEDMAQVIAEYDVPVVTMYNGRFCNHEGDIIESIKKSLCKSISLAKDAGVKEQNIILDPGIGFGISAEESMEIMRRLSELKKLGHPLLLGTSRKSMLGEILDLPPKERVEGTLATTVMGIMQGVDIVRVHDIKENLRGAQVTDAIFRK